MDAFRWWLFKRLSAFGWWICPEPHRTNLQAVMPTWQRLEDTAEQISVILRKRA